MRELMAEAEGGALTTVVVNLETGAAAENVTPATLDAALEDPANWTQLTPEKDTAGIGARPDLAQIYLLRDGDRVSLAIFPVMGAGYVGPISAMLAMRGDMTTIAGMTVTSQEETPGLGARIEEPAWQASFAGTKVTDEQGNIRFNVARGPASGAYEVDGITGAVVELARLVGVDTPMVDVIYGLLRQRAREAGLYPEIGFDPLAAA